jgi:predicted ABC-type ATPase
MTKRMRVFAGPNGSGKTTIIQNLKNEIGFGVYVNADDIEQQLNASKSLLFNQYQLKVDNETLQSFFRNSTFSPIKRNQPELYALLHVDKNILHINAEIDSYLAADIAEFIRQQLLANELSFTYETVMSHRSKLAFMKKAKEQGYRVYLYFVATEDPEINVSRVNLRFFLNGHFVPPEVIKDRYYKSLTNLKEAVKLSDRAYIWDNSSMLSLLVAEITNGNNVSLINPEKVPAWFVKYLLGNEKENQ